MFDNFSKLTKAKLTTPMKTTIRVLELSLIVQSHFLVYLIQPYFTFC